MAGTPCDDGNFCTYPDRCGDIQMGNGGVCLGQTVLDGLPCGTGVCVGGVCTETPAHPASGPDGGSAGGNAQGGGAPGAGGAGGVDGKPAPVTDTKLLGGGCEASGEEKNTESIEWMAIFMVMLGLGRRKSIKSIKSIKAHPGPTA